MASFKDKYEDRLLVYLNILSEPLPPASLLEFSSILRTPSSFLLPFHISRIKTGWLRNKRSQSLQVTGKP